MDNRVSVYGGHGFILGEFCRKFPANIIRIEKNEVVPSSPKVLYGISTTDNYNLFDSVTLDIETNLIHLVEVLDACYKTYGNKFEFNFISSWFVYGTGSTMDKPFTEDAACNPKGFYSITKRCAEQLVESYCETFGIKYRILRLANILGARDRKVSKKKNALQFLIDRLVLNEDIELYDGGNFYRDYMDVRDCVVAIESVILSDLFGTINISNGKSHRFKDLIDHAVFYSDSKGHVWLEKSESTQFHSVVQSKDIFLDGSRLRGLGYIPKYTIKETLEAIIDDYKR